MKVQATSCAGADATFARSRTENSNGDPTPPQISVFARLQRCFILAGLEGQQDVLSRVSFVVVCDDRLPKRYSLYRETTRAAYRAIPERMIGKIPTAATGSKSPVARRVVPTGEAR